jgi:DNA polymerase IV
MGIERIGKLAELTLDTLVVTFGESYGSFLCEASHGIDEAPLVAYWEPRSMSRETTFQQDVGQWQTIAKSWRI